MRVRFTYFHLTYFSVQVNHIPYSKFEDIATPRICFGIEIKTNRLKDSNQKIRVFSSEVTNRLTDLNQKCPSCSTAHQHTKFEACSSYRSWDILLTRSYRTYRPIIRNVSFVILKNFKNAIGGLLTYSITLLIYDRKSNKKELIFSKINYKSCPYISDQFVTGPSITSIPYS